MRVPLLLVPLALLLAGCTEDANLANAAEEDPPVDPWPEGSPTPPTPTSPTPPTSSSPPPPTTSPPAPTTKPPTPDEPVAHQPIPWTLNASLTMGYVAGVGAGSAQEQSPQEMPTNGVNDASHCADAAFTVPPEATAIVLVFSGAPIAANEDDPASSGAGMFELRVTAPDGTEEYVALPVPPGAETVSVSWTAPSAAEGAWNLHAYPVGPTANQVWSLAITVSGASLAPPTALAAATAC